jgi:isoaspartyl peptidase/L-asparaginase-like protein (Ntn-hydrolase superfamily)
MSTIVVWILVAVSSAGTGRSEFAIPAFSPAVASADDCQKLLEAAQRVITKSDGRNKGPSMECIAINVPSQIAYPPVTSKSMRK